MDWLSMGLAGASAALAALTAQGIVRDRKNRRVTYVTLAVVFIALNGVVKEYSAPSC